MVYPWTVVDIRNIIMNMRTRRSRYSIIIMNDMYKYYIGISCGQVKFRCNSMIRHESYIVYYIYDVYKLYIIPVVSLWHGQLHVYIIHHSKPNIIHYVLQI